MASTYSPSLRIELIGQGEQSGTWGITTNNNLGSIIEQAITGVQTITMANATYTLTSYDGAVDQARNAVLVLAGTNLAPQDLIAPSVEKVYLVKNSTGNTVTIKTSGGNGASIRDGSYAQVYCDGIDFYNATSSGNSVVGDLAVSGSITAGANITATNTVFANTISATNYLGITGRIVQTVKSTNGTYAATSSGTYAPTGHTASITPTSTSSKILVMCSSMFWQTNQNNGNAFLTIYRNSTDLATGGPLVMQNAATSGASSALYGSMSYQLLDSPASTSTLTYQPYIKADSGGNAAYNGSGSATLVLLEIL